MTISLFEDHLLDGTHAARPVATAVANGTLYSCSDHGLIYQSDGAAWATWATLGGGGLDAEGVRDTMAATLVAGSNVTITADDAGDTITIDAASGGGGGGGGGGVDDPSTWSADLGYDQEFTTDGVTLPTGWAWHNQGVTATYKQQYGHGQVIEPSTEAADRFRLIDRAIPSDAAWVATAKLIGEVRAANYAGAAVTLRNSATGKIVSWGPSYNSAWVLDLGIWSTANGGGITHPVLTTDGDAFKYPYWRIRKNSATSWDFEYSDNGVFWTGVAAATARNVETDLGGAPTHIGFGVWRYGRTMSAGLDWFRVR